MYLFSNCWYEEILKQKHHFFSLHSNPIRITQGKDSDFLKGNQMKPYTISPNSNYEVALKECHFRNVSKSIDTIYTCYLRVWELQHVKGRFSFSLHIFLLSLAKTIKLFNMKSNKEKIKENDSTIAKLTSDECTVSLRFQPSIFSREVKVS